MSLNSFHFVMTFLFLFCVLLFLEGIKRKKKCFQRLQIITLLIFSYYFIYTWDWRFCICVASITVVTYFIGIGMDKFPIHKKKIFLLGIVFLLCFLGYFKYTNFFVSGFAKIFGEKTLTLNILLPIGISFYIFSALSYIIDVYRGTYMVVRDIIEFSLYISFFPKLTAGPIIRGSDFFPQITDYVGIKAKNFEVGIQTFVLGLFKKMVLADHLGVFVNDIFYAPVAFNTGTVLWGIVSYSLQIYFDFSGYSDMAIGIAKILGFDFRRNFNLPYMAKGISDFWRRWHISLSSWFMDYLYIPLGGSKRGNFRTYFNLMIVMLVSGLWHGAGWTFLVWGGLHGFASCIERFFKKKKVFLLGWINIGVTYVLVSLFWVFFRADSLENAWNVIKSGFTIHTGICQPYAWTFFSILCLMIGTVMAYFHSKKVGDKDKNGAFYINGYYPIMDLTKVVSLTIFFTFCGLTLIMGYFGDTAFIYGKF